LVSTTAAASVQHLLDDLVANGQECGLQVAAYVDGRLVLDAWAGVADEETGRPVDGDTLFTVFSATKGVAATAIHILADRGRLDYDAPIADYWPEFAARGKGRVTLRHALSHQAGIPRLPEGITPETLCDWEAMCAAIADLEPLWEPGSRTAYHGMTYGWLVGEVLRRVDGRDIRAFVRDEISRPLGARDLNIGIAPADEARVARLRPASAAMTTSFPVDVWNRSDVRRAIIPAGGGLFTARSLARHYAMLAGGGQLDGARLLSPERIALAATPHTRAADAAEIGMSFGLGYRLGSPIYPEGGILTALSERPSVFGHTGAGGTIGFADPERRFAFALTKNLLHPATPGQTSTTVTIVRTVRDALGVV
jgi:CubicO group peptidase (beta-lactamase class C family)